MLMAKQYLTIAFYPNYSLYWIFTVNIFGHRNVKSNFEPIIVKQIDICACVNFEYLVIMASKINSNVSDKINKYFFRSTKQDVFLKFVLERTSWSWTIEIFL